MFEAPVLAYNIKCHHAKGKIQEQQQNAAKPVMKIFPEKVFPQLLMSGFLQQKIPHHSQYDVVTGQSVKPCGMIIDSGSQLQHRIQHVHRQRTVQRPFD